MVQVLYEDNHLLVVVKPPNLPVQADSSGDEDLLTLLKGYIKEKYSKPGDVYLGLVHRLDRPVGGVMVFARTSKAAARLSAQFNGHSTKKNYLALLCGKGGGGSIQDHILRDTNTGNSSAVPEGTPNAKPASLSYTPCAYRNGLTLAHIALHTGRHHQIRVQFASRGLPLWGDQRYNKKAVPGQQIALWACSLTFEHPTKKESMTFTSMPEGGGWKDFENILAPAVHGIGVAYMDSDIIAAVKPANLPTAREDGEGESLEERLCEIYGEAYPAHRLDANTTGLVLFARSEKALAALTDAVKQRSIRKFYRCTVKGTPKREEAELNSYCIKDESKGRLFVYDKAVPGAKNMITRYRVLRSGKDTSDLEVELITGRTHQIRAHLAHIGNPIVGDDKYGDREFNKRKGAKTQMLRAVRLELEFPQGSCLERLNGRVIKI